jgi:hypothetical protein
VRVELGRDLVGPLHYHELPVLGESVIGDAVLDEPPHRAVVEDVLSDASASSCNVQTSA